jgi:hypothetical protein
VWYVYTVGDHVLVEACETFAQANERKRRLGLAGVACVVSPLRLTKAKVPAIRVKVKTS